MLGVVLVLMYFFLFEGFGVLLLEVMYVDVLILMFNFFFLFEVVGEVVIIVDFIDVDVFFVGL